MQRYFIPREQLGDHKAFLAGDDAHHAARVMRMEKGGLVIVSDSSGRVALVKAAEVSPSRVEADIVEWLTENSEPRWSVTVAQSLPKGDKMELVIQKGTEIGAAAFIPFQSERMVVQYDGKKEAKRLERWSKIAKEAAEQAHRSRVPAVEAVHTWRSLIAAVERYDLVLFCYEKESGAEQVGLRAAIQRYCRSRRVTDDSTLKMMLIVGPEGGFTEREAAEAEAAGAVLVGLGKRILRTETAALVGLACLMYESGEMGGV